MNRLLLLSLALVLAVAAASCSGDDDAVSTSGQRVYADQQYYPTLPETVWRYRVDSTGADKRLVRDAYRINSRITGTTFTANDTTYTVQVNEEIRSNGTSFDTLYVRKDDRGVFMSSPSLRNFSLLGQLGAGLNLGTFPKEFMILPLHPEYVTNWDIIRFDYTILILNIRFWVTAQYMGRENVTTDMGVFRDCAKVRITVDALFPNPADPTNILNPLRINDKADFWLARPLGLVVGDGAASVFALLNGRVPLSLQARKLHMEPLDMSIAQPSGPCASFR
ncbi:MAG: hypothetical protein IPP94_02190 [Ignavibacteria bacterium]|nr:hypothetical protein [Ignavibacteria bacterium]